jgi:hypothetical protein
MKSTKSTDEVTETLSVLTDNPYKQCQKAYLRSIMDLFNAFKSTIVHFSPNCPRKAKWSSLPSSFYAYQTTLAN